MGKRLRLFARLFAHSPPGRWPALGWYLLATAIRKATGLVLLRDTVLCFDGIRILADTEGRVGLGFIEEILFDGEYQRLPRGRVVFDAGANCGYFALARSMQDPGARVWCFEPHPGTFRTLVRNVELNGLGGRVIPVHAAVGGRSGTCRLDVSPSSTMAIVQGARSHGSVRTESVEVPMVTLDEIARREGVWPDVLKVDVEGCEVEALNGGVECLAHARALVIETHSDELTRQCIGILKEAGFEVETDHLVHAWRRAQ